ncbi:MAG: glycerophosphodiester phosphodiesterase [Patescibacteria group bacterium]|nr:glycerophosphodiester phosphodiesterase [Patescibacteria group bacterium]
MPPASPGEIVGKRPRIIAHRGGKAHGRENDVATIQRTLAYKPDIVEVDVRKSKDGILYCYHGSIPFGITAAQFFYRLNFSWIQRFAGKRDTLGAVLRVIPEDTIALLDLKDKHITAEDLLPFIGNRENVWIETTSERHMELLRQEFEEDVEYVVSRPLFFMRHMLPMVLGLTNTLQLVVDGERENFLAYKDLSKTRQNR